MPAEFLRGPDALEAHLTGTKVPFRKSEDGTALLVAIQMIPGVVAPAVVRWGAKPQLFECVTLVPIPITDENRAAIAAAVQKVNDTLPASAFVLTDAGLFHVANALLNEDGSLSSKIADLAIAATRVACDRHFGTLLGANRPAPAARPTPIVSHAPATLAPDEMERLHEAIAAGRPSFAPRLERRILVEEVTNPWFKRARILSVQSPAPMPAVAITACISSDGEARVLSGHPEALTELARAELVTLASPEAARAYANVGASWTRAADFPELPVPSFDDIPFRPHTDAAAVEELRGEVGARITAPALLPRGDGWQLDVWVVSLSRLVHRLVTVGRDGSFAIDDDVVVAAMPVFPGRSWGMVGGRLVPIG